MWKTFSRSPLRFSNSSSSSRIYNARTCFKSNSNSVPARPKQQYSSPSPSSSSSSYYSSSSSSSRSRLALLSLSLAPIAVAVAVAFSDTTDITTATLPAGILTSAFGLWSSSKTPTSHSHSHSQLPLQREKDPITMAPPPPASTLPGRPGNLKKEEEAKLKELWLAFFKVFGLNSPTISEPASPPPPPPPPETPLTEELNSENLASPDAARKKSNRKSFGRFMGRRSRSEKEKEKEVEKKETLVQEVVANVDTSDDKYGQTAEFKAALANQTPAELREAFWGMVKCDNPDALLLRFLRARKWDVDKALVMMVATMNWRSKELNVQGIIEKGEGGYAADTDQGFIKQLRMGKSFLHGCDKEGRPICLVRVRLHKQADQNEEALEHYTVYIMETARLMLRDPTDTAAVVFDMTGFSMANMDYAPVKYLIKCFEAHYPESLGICLVHKAPWIFQSIWSIIRGWLDPVVASKIHFTKSTEDMEVFIPRSNILKDLGGDDDWEYSYVDPKPGENDAIANGAEVRAKILARRDEQVREYEALTRAWIGAPAEEEAERVKGERWRVAGLLREGYWELDPYTRARTVYDRTGILGEKGKLDFYNYRATSAAATNAVVVTSADDID